MTRLTAAVEVGGLVRKAQAGGDFATILRKGDPERGAILLIVTSRGRHVACLERMLAPDGNYRWTKVGPDPDSEPHSAEGASTSEIGRYLDKRARFDLDSWLVELDIAEAERFIAETTLAG